MDETLAVLLILTVPPAMALIGIFVADKIRSERGSVPLLDPAWRCLHACMERALRRLRIIR